MDTEKAVPDTESYQERLSFCVQILSFFTTNFIGHCAVVQNCWFFTKSTCKKKKKQYNMYNDIDQSSRINLSLRIYQVGGDRNMNRYSISFKHSDDGKHWYTTSRMVEAESDFSAMEIIKSGYPYVQIISVHKVG